MRHEAASASLRASVAAASSGSGVSALSDAGFRARASSLAGEAFEFRTNRPGMELARTGSFSARKCRSQCLDTPACKAWVFDEEEDAGRECSLKAGVPGAVFDQECCVSGVISERVR